MTWSPHVFSITTKTPPTPFGSKLIKNDSGANRPTMSPTCLRVVRLNESYTGLAIDEWGSRRFPLLGYSAWIASCRVGARSVSEKRRILSEREEIAVSVGKRKGKSIVSNQFRFSISRFY